MKKSLLKILNPVVSAGIGLLMVQTSFSADKAPRSPSYGTVMQANAAVDAAYHEVCRASDR